MFDESIMKVRTAIILEGFVMALKSTLAGLAAAAALGSVLLLGAPQKAEAGVHIGIGVPGIYFGGYPAYGYYGGYGYYPGYYHYPRYRHHRHWRHKHYRHGWKRHHRHKHWKRYRRR